MSLVGRQSDERRPDSSLSAHVAVGPPLDQPTGLPQNDKMMLDQQLNVVGPTDECRWWADNDVLSGWLLVILILKIHILPRLL